MAGFGWWAKTIWEAHQKLRDDHSALHVLVKGEYVTNSRFENVLRDIDSKLDRIFDKLDGKEERRHADR